jgi:ferrochelatase
MPRLDAVLLAGFGGPEAMQDVRPFLENVVRGRPIPKERFEEVVHHYELLGGRSPFNAITRQQAALLRTQLSARGLAVPVSVGMRCWQPYLRDSLHGLVRSGARRIAVVIMAAHRTEASDQRYRVALGEALAELGEDPPELVYTAGFHASPGFVTANAEQVRAALARLGAGDYELWFSAHSVPIAMAADSAYVAELEHSARLVAQALGVAAYRIVYQSRSGPPTQPWLEPDVNAALREAAARGVQRVVLSPIGFVCDHVEVLYDLDVEARQTAATLGIRLERAGAAGTHPAFIEGLAERVLAC